MKSLHLQEGICQSRSSDFGSNDRGSVASRWNPAEGSQAHYLAHPIDPDPADTLAHYHPPPQQCVYSGGWGGFGEECRFFLSYHGEVKLTLLVFILLPALLEFIFT